MNNTINFLITAGSAFIINLLITPLLIYISHKKGWYDSIDHRKIHTGSISRLGGMGIFISFFIVIVILLIFKQYILSISISNIIILLTVLAANNFLGLIDDFTNLRPRYKLVLQIIISLFLVIYGFGFKTIYIPFIEKSISLGVFSYPITFLWIIGLINAVNLIDGVDGLAGGISLLSLIGFTIIFSLLAVPGGAIVSIILVGAIAGFLVFNLPPAKIFMGDSGSLFLGTAVAVLPLIFSHEKMFIASVSLLFFPITDTIFAIIRRSLKKEPFYKPDKSHIHHMLLHIGFKTKGIISILYSFTIMQVIVTIIWFSSNNLAADLILFLSWVINILALCVLSNKNKKKLNNQ